MGKTGTNAGLFGRDTELATIEGALERHARASATLELSGEPGIGKTRLLKEVCRLADARGALVLEGSAAEFERDLPFGTLLDAFDDYLGSLNPRLFERLAPDWRGELARIFPSLSMLAESAPRGPADERYRSHRAIRAMLETLAAERPLLLALDDVQWTDDASQEAIAHMLRRPPRAPVMLVVAHRPQLSPRLDAALAAARRAEVLESVELSPLARADADLLLEDRFGDRISVDERSRIEAESGGNPFYLEQLGRAADDGRPISAPQLADATGVPTAVAAAIAAEVAELSDRARTVLQTAAALGDPFEPDLIGELCEVDEAGAMAALDELLARDLVRATEVPRRFRFRHPIVRRAVYTSAPHGWRLAAHRRAADLLAIRGAPAAARAHHLEWSAQHGDAEAIGVLTAAAEAAAPRAPAAAAHWYRAALRLAEAEGPGQRLGLLVPMAMALGGSGRFEESLVALREVLALLPADQVAVRARVVGACARLEHVLGRHGEARALLVSALEALADRSAPEATALKLELGADAFFAGDFEAMRPWLLSALDDAEARDDASTRAAATGLLGATEYLTDDVAAAFEWYARYEELFAGLEDAELASHLLAHTWSATGLVFCERFDLALAVVERCRGVAESTGQAQIPALTRTVGAFALLWKGRIADAEDQLEAAVEASSLSGNRQALAWALWVRCWAATLAGELGAARRHGEESVAIAGSEPDPVSALAGCYLAGAEFESGAEPPASRERVLRAVGGPELELIERGFKSRWYELLTRIELAAGDDDAAEEWARRAEEAAAGLGLGGRTADALQARAAVSLKRGDPGQAAEAALAAVEAAEGAELPIEGARARTLAARALAAAGDRDAAVSELERAWATLEALGAGRYRDEAARELRLLGRRVARAGREASADDAIGSLSAREREVAELVAAGRTNREIAAELYLSVKTIETHLARIFRKLDVSKRAQLARLVGGADKAAG